MKKLIGALKKYNRISVVDQQDLEKDYGITWDEMNSYINEIETKGTMISDKEVSGFEETIWQYRYENYLIQEEVVYGIGAFSIIKLIEE
jgi:hypothetical protein